ncbi:MAG: OmpH family outer membrane protein [Bacteroidales bacterium]|jgi:Skp family chaperone for outer membrane proteins|nr:OmpH family outer membrane protein [Bacteroidales bacterium]
MSELIQNLNESGNEITLEKENRAFPWLAWAGLGISVLSLIGVIVLFVLYFTTGQKQAIVDVPVPVAGSGEVVYINVDSINKNYRLVEILTTDIEEEQARQESIFANRQKSLEKKALQFQENYQKNILTPVQVQNAQEQLQQEGSLLREEYEQALSNFQVRHAAALQQIADSLVAATRRVNASRNASYVFSYQYGGQLLLADPSKDITNAVLEELNKAYGTKK